MQKTDKPNPTNLQLIAEELLKNKVNQSITKLSEEKILKLVHELEVHQIELEMQNEELKLALQKVEDATQKNTVIEQQMLEKKLNETEENYRILFENMNAGVFQTTLDGTFLQMNNTMIEMSGYDSMWELMSKNASCLYADNYDRDKLIQNLRLNGEVRNWEVKTLKKDGSSQWVSLNAVLQHDISGKPEKILGIAYDITERKNSEVNLKESEEKYRNLIELAVDGVLIGSHEGLIIDANSCICSITGLSRDKLIGKHISTVFFTKESLEKTPLRFDLLQKGEIVVSERDIIRPDGTIITVEMRTKLMPNHTYQSIYRDITDRKKAEEELKSSISLINASIESTADGILIVNTEGKITKWNQKFADMWQIPDDILSSHDDKIVINNILSKLSNPKQFLSKVRDLYAHLEDTSLDNIEFLSGKIFERYSQPQRIGDEVVGRVWSFRDITERKRVDEALIESEEKYRSFIENSTSACVLTDEVGNIIEWNKAAEEITEISKKEIQVCKVYDLQFSLLPMNLEEHEKYVEIMKNFYKTGDFAKLTKYSETAFTTKSNTIKYVNQHLFGFKTKNGFRLAGIISDITKQKRIERALIESEENYRNLINNMIEGLVIVNHEENFIFTNPAAEQIFGVGRGELIGKNLYDFLSEETAIFITEMTNQRRNGLKNTFEHDIIQPNGSIRQIIISASAQFDKQGGFTSTIAIFRDITDRKLMEEALKESEERQRLILELTTDYFFKADVDIMGKVIINYVSKDTNNITGRPLEEFNTPDLWTTIIHPEDLEFSMKFMNSLLASGEPGELECRSYTKDGKMRFIRILARPVHDKKSNKIVSIVGAIKDITESKLIEADIQKKNAELMELNASKDKFFSILAHDLRSPFNGFLGLTKMMAEEIRDLKIHEMQEFALNMQKSANNLYTLLDNLLEWSKMQRGITEYSPNSVNLLEIVEKNINIIKDTSNQKNIEIINNIIENKQIIADISMLNTIFRNLLSNAIKFTHSGGRIEIGSIIKHSQDSNSNCIIYIKDTGIGMDSDTICKLFKIDQKVSRKGTSGELSSGLGLLLCKEFIEKNEGKIWVESEVGKGSTFYFTLKHN